MRVIPAIVLWQLWKNRNAQKNGKSYSYSWMSYQYHQLLTQFIKGTFKWLKNISHNWGEVVELISSYRPKLYFLKVKWEVPVNGGLVCNTDGASRGNPGPSAYGFCIRNSEGNLVYAEA